MQAFLFKQIDNTSLVLFRIAFGFILTIEAFGAIEIGWVRRILVEPEFTFNFIGFEFLQPLPGNGMYFYYVLMGIFGILITLGYRYRIAIIGFALLWTGVCLMEKSANNNFYYLVMLLSWIMAFLPANRALSLDAKYTQKIRSISMPQWCLWVLILQVWIVFTFAALTKLYPDWLSTKVVALHMENRSDYPYIGSFLQNNALHSVLTYGGLIFDALIVPALFWKRTRNAAFIVSLLFHGFNLFVFRVGTLPLLSIAFALFFFSPETLKKRFALKKELNKGSDFIIPRFKKLGLIVFSIYFMFQLGLPLRHWFFTDDVLWTGEGRRLSWRMLVELKEGEAAFQVVDKKTGDQWIYEHEEVLTRKQYRALTTRPDMIWQMAQYIKESHAEWGTDVAVHVTARISINGGPYHAFIDPEVDLGSQPWSHFKHHDWILESPEDYHKASTEE